MNNKPVLTSFIEGRCPQCRQGKIFKTSVFNLTNFKKINDHCPHCGVKFESEPGFFWGAMYFSYALNVGMAIVIGTIFFNVYEDPPLGTMIFAVLGINVALSPLIFRLARLLMMYVAAPYRKYKEELNRDEKP